MTNYQFESEVGFEDVEEEFQMNEHEDEHEDEVDLFAEVSDDPEYLICDNTNEAFDFTTIRDKISGIDELFICPSCGKKHYYDDLNEEDEDKFDISDLYPNSSQEEAYGDALDYILKC